MKVRAKVECLKLFLFQSCVPHYQFGFEMFTYTFVVRQLKV